MTRRPFLAQLVFVVAFVAGCTEVKTVVIPAPEAGAIDAAPPVEEPQEDAGPAPVDAGAKKDANGPGAAGDECSFNHDCTLTLRCECDGTCACAEGKRGTKMAGVACVDANDCASAVCLEGPDDALLCSDECKNAAECPTALPVCKDINFVGRICVRQP